MAAVRHGTSAGIESSEEKGTRMNAARSREKRSLGGRSAGEATEVGRRERACRRRPERRKGMPLALVIARYFAYAFIAAGLVAIVAFGTLIALVEGGFVYAANYAESNADAAIGALESGEISPDELPSCYRWAVFDADGNAAASDMPAAEVPEARKTLESGESVTHVGLLGSAMLQVKAALPDGGTCVLQYDYVPDFTSRELRDALPDPQTLATVLLGVLFAAAMALIATRAARVISAKMRPLAQAAAHIERQELDFEVGRANVREVNDVLAAMERMRVALRESLEARWQAEEAQRAQMAALAHDLKTPLTVVRANAEYLSEEEGLSLDAREAAEASAEGARRLDAYVRLIIDASRGGGADVRRERVDAASWANACDEAARRVADARGVRLETVQEESFVRRAKAAPLLCDAVALERAALNLVDNACDHAPAGSTVRLAFGCEDAEAPRDEAGAAAGAASTVDRAGGEHGRLGARVEDADGGTARVARARKEGAGGGTDGAAQDAAGGAAGGAAPMLVLAVEDEGAGFTSAALSRGCERFFRDDASRTRAAAGSGRGKAEGAKTEGAKTEDDKAERAKVEGDGARGGDVGDSGRCGGGVGADDADSARKGGGASDSERGEGFNRADADGGEARPASAFGCERGMPRGGRIEPEGPDSAPVAEAAHYGLGLSIAADIAQAHGGSVALENRPCGGARAILRASWE